MRTYDSLALLLALLEGGEDLLAGSEDDNRDEDKQYEQYLGHSGTDNDVEGKRTKEWAKLRCLLFG